MVKIRLRITTLTTAKLDIETLIKKKYIKKNVIKTFNIDIRVSSLGFSPHCRIYRADDITAYHIDELRKLELYFNGEGVCDIDHWTNQLVVIRQEVVVQSLRVWVS